MFIVVMILGSMGQFLSGNYRPSYIHAKFRSGLDPENIPNANNAMPMTTTRNTLDPFFYFSSFYVIVPKLRSGQ